MHLAFNTVRFIIVFLLLLHSHVSPEDLAFDQLQFSESNYIWNEHIVLESYTAELLIWIVLRRR